jgi:hypothetical protein
MTVQDDSFISEILASYVPERREIAPEWDGVLDRAGLRTRYRGRPARRALLVAFAVLFVAMLASALALSAEHDWWFLREDGMSPTPSKEGVVIVATGVWDGHSWTLSAFRTNGAGPTGKQDLCFALDNAMSCGPIPGSSSKRPQKITFMESGGSAGPGLPPDPPNVTGPVGDEVTHVRIELADGHAIETGTIPAPAKLGLSVRFFATPLPRCAELKRVVALDDQNNIVAQDIVPRSIVPRSQGC